MTVASDQAVVSGVVAPDGINGEYVAVPEDAVPRLRRSAGTAGLATEETTLLVLLLSIPT